MDISKVKLNPIAIKNYLFEIGLINSIKSNQITIKIGDKQSLETHINLYLGKDEKDCIGDVYRSIVDGKIYLMGKEVASWEDVKKVINF